MFINIILLFKTMVPIIMLRQIVVFGETSGCPSINVYREINIHFLISSENPREPSTILCTKIIYYLNLTPNRY